MQAEEKGQEIVDAVDRVRSDPGEHGAEMELLVDAVQLRRPDQAIEGGSAVTAGIGPGEQIVLPSMEISA